MIEYKVLDKIPEELDLDEVNKFLEPFEQVLVRFVDGEPSEVIYIDGSDAPEDLSLSRSLHSLVRELNRIANQSVDTV